MGRFGQAPIGSLPTRSNRIWVSAARPRPTDQRKDTRSLIRRGQTCSDSNTIMLTDISPSQVDAAAARGVTGITLEPAVDYLKQRRGRYALIAAFSVLEHQTRAELFELLDSIRDGLVPGGSLIAVVPNTKGLFGAHVRFADITHELSFSPGSVSQICAVAGLELTVVLEHGPLVHGFVSAVRWTAWQVIRSALLAARLAEGADWRWPVFTQDLVFVASKPVGTSSATR